MEISRSQRVHHQTSSFSEKEEKGTSGKKRALELRDSSERSRDHSLEAILTFGKSAKTFSHLIGRKRTKSTEK